MEKVGKRDGYPGDTIRLGPRFLKGVNIGRGRCGLRRKEGASVRVPYKRWWVTEDCLENTLSGLIRPVAGWNGENLLGLAVVGQNQDGPQSVGRRESVKPRSSESKGFVGWGGPRKIETTKVPARGREQPPLSWSEPRVGTSNRARLGH